MRLKTREKKKEKLLYHYVEACKTSVRTQVSLLKDQRFHLPVLMSTYFGKTIFGNKSKKIYLVI